MNILDFFSVNKKIIILGCVLLSVLFFIDKPLGAGIIFVILLTAIFFLFADMCKDEKSRKILGILFLIVFILHILGVLFFNYTKFQPFSGGYGDYILYQQQTEEIAQRVVHGNFSLQNIPMPNNYPIIIGYIYATSIPSMLIGQLFNAWLVALSVIFIYLIIREIGGTEKEAFLTAIVASVYPSLAFYGSLLLKDGLVVLLCTMGLLMTLKIVKKFSYSKFVIFYILSIGLVHFRFYVGYALLLSFIFSWLILSKLKIKERIVYGFIMLLFFGFLPMISNGDGYFGVGNFKHFLNVDTITFYREVVYAPPAQPEKEKSQSQIKLGDFSSEKGNSSVVIKTGLENPLSFVKNTTISFIYSFLGPFPWQLSSIRQYLVMPEVFAWYFALFFIIKGAVKSLKDKNMAIISLIIFSGLVFGVLAIFINNFGIITRIRMPAFMALLCLFPFGFEKMKNFKIPLLNKIF